MSKELADSIVIAAHIMTRNEVTSIGVIRYDVNKKRHKYRIECPVRRGFSSFEKAYNYMATKGYHKVSSDANTDFKKSLKISKEAPVIMVMSKKVNKEEISTKQEE
jgi:hypothetical protein